MTILLRLLPYLAAVGLILGAGWYLHQRGYESGHADSEAHWQPLFDAAAIEHAKAEARAATQEAQSKILTARREAEHATVVASLELRATAADARVRQLMRHYNPSAGCGSLPETGRAAASVDAAESITERNERAGANLVALAHRCEADAAKLTMLQGWIREQFDLARQE